MLVDDTKPAAHTKKREEAVKQSDLRSTGKAAAYTNHHKEINGDWRKKGEEVNALFMLQTDTGRQKKGSGNRSKIHTVLHSA